MIFVLQGCKLNLQQQTMLLYLYAIDIPIYQAQKMLPEIAHSMLVRYYKSLRSTISNAGASMILGGTVDGATNIVEIDESMFGKKRKYNRGKPTKRFWVFGMVERHTRKSHFQCVEKRDRDTLIPIIAKHVAPGTVIHHDDWGAYTHLEREGYSNPKRVFAQTQLKVNVWNISFKKKIHLHTVWHFLVHQNYHWTFNIHIECVFSLTCMCLLLFIARPVE